MINCSPNTSQRFLRGHLTSADEQAFVRHLDGCTTCQRLLETNAASDDDWSTAKALLAHERPTDPASDSDEMAATAAALLSPSDDPRMLGRIGPYEVLGVIGRGGMGIVFKGYDRALNRNVAIKMLEPHLASIAAARRRFAQEARAMAAVSHEHVVPVYAVDDQAVTPYFVMEYVAGGSLENRLQRQGAFDVLEVIRIALQMSRALDAAHRQGLVHRDIKPGNVLLDAGTERVRVADFGLARVSTDASMTHSGMIAGTPHYMSPEQVRGETCDARSDLFSLGGVIYALCAGHPPFRAENMYGVMQRVVNDQPRALRESNPLTPEWLETLVICLLAKQPADRLASAAELVSILEAELAHLQNPRANPTPPRAWQPNTYSHSRRWRWSGFSFVASAAALGCTAFVLWRDPPPQKIVQPPAAPAIPLWNSDGMAAAQRAATELEQRWSGQEFTPRDPWNQEFREVQQGADSLLGRNGTEF